MALHYIFFPRELKNSLLKMTIRPRFTREYAPERPLTLGLQPAASHGPARSGCAAQSI